ncbi:hypothetical protein [Martelella endophytica]|uniref:Uncharacterized protein n=1 Tax=Martelella endophytica TaxID=1486262 RepID=A0A0D5LV81_MAREN|nr:hypothetical protein [Martelella endophytica]AJY47293.1 hypothetical protein TM49_19055 [Martelella endophytica]
MTGTDLSPRISCHLVSVAGFSFCRCGWSDHPMIEAPCADAQEEAEDAAIRRVIESGTDWRPREHFLADGSGLTVDRKAGAA